MASRWVAAADPTTDPDYFVLMADTHLLRRAEDTRRNVKPAEAFGQTIKEILALPKRPSGLVIAGDCAHEDPRGYATLQSLLKPLQKAGLSIHVTMGNHDRRDGLVAAFPGMKFESIGQEKTPSKLVSVWETPLRTAKDWDKLPSVLSIRPARYSQNTTPAMKVDNISIASLSDDGKRFRKIIARNTGFIFLLEQAYSINANRMISLLDAPKTG